MMDNEVTETPDQICLRKWIAAGLSIPEVRELQGDSGYLLCNMIAKYSLASSTYRVSEAALKQMTSDGIMIEKVQSRSMFYGKGKPYIYEHAIPARITRTQLLECALTDENVKRILLESGPVAILLRAEDATLNSLGFRHSMPKSWSWGSSVFARYDAAHIQLSDKRISMTGGLRR